MMQSNYRRQWYRAVSPIDGEPMSDINTTPLIDVLLVLLIMFIITIPIATHQITMNLPQAGPVRFAEQVPHLLVITQSGAVTLDGARVDGRALSGRLAALAADPRAELRITTDPAARYEVFAETLAEVKRAGITRLGFVGNEPFGR